MISFFVRLPISPRLVLVQFRFAKNAMTSSSSSSPLSSASSSLCVCTHTEKHLQFSALRIASVISANVDTIFVSVIKLLHWRAHREQCECMRAPKEVKGLYCAAPCIAYGRIMAAAIAEYQQSSYILICRTSLCCTVLLRVEVVVYHFRYGTSAHWIGGAENRNRLFYLFTLRHIHCVPDEVCAASADADDDWTSYRFRTNVK